MVTVTRFVAKKPMVILCRSNCCMSHTIKTLISSFGDNPTVYEFWGQQMERELKALGCKPSVAAVYVEQDLRSANEIMSLHLKGKLVPLLLKSNAIWVYRKLY